MRRHKQSVHQSVKHTCQICGHKATTKGSLTTHIQNKHEGKKYLCDVCNEEYNSQPGLWRHIKLKHEEGNTFNCTVCKYSSRIKAQLNWHIKSKHLKEKQSFACGKCDFKATLKSNLSRHIENIHQERDKIMCIECDKSMKQQWISQHIKIFHSEQGREYNCNMCVYKTKYLSNFSRHVKLVHKKC